MAKAKKVWVKETRKKAHWRTVKPKK